MITKHCKPADRLRMLNGHFKIGSHAEYSDAKGTGLLSDTAEGEGATLIPGDVANFSGVVGGFQFKNCSSFGSQYALKIEERINTSIFCASLGDYCNNRHMKIMKGDIHAGYPANPDVTAFLTLDVSRLLEALSLAATEYHRCRSRWIGSAVYYGPRRRNITPRAFEGMRTSEINRRIYEQAFTKPEKFSCEEEYRLILYPPLRRTTPKSIFTNSLSDGVQRSFQAAIVDSGADQPRE